mmetsp:Transcript_23725/g.33288  ORF Transcript_23725/g.33288 Transcript_23725/m.33288 type:complete len:707 (+) Transcript_23725:80-2200(+)
MYSSSIIRWNGIEVFALLLLFNSAFAFTIQNDFAKSFSHSVTKIIARASHQNEQEDNSRIDADSDRKESQMPDYINAFLEKSRQEEEYEEGSANEVLNEHDRFTHMIGIPMEQCHELMLQLESVQRAVIHNCPCLVNSCIVPVMTRLPMLYVEATPSATPTATGDLQAIVQRVVKKRLFVKQEPKEDNSITDKSDDEALFGPNKNGHLPLLLTFEKLEIDGDNEVLYTTCRETEQVSVLIDVLDEIRNEIESLGYKTSLPPNDNFPGDEWKPRVPFMRLPDNFEETLPPLKDDVKEFMRDPDQGGNGISPILWCKWWDDVFAENTRMREIGVYVRQPSEKGLGESAFYFPHETIKLPKGNEALTAAESRDSQYQEARMADAEKVVETASDGIPDTNVEKARELFESLYEDSTIENEQKENSFGSTEDNNINSLGNDESLGAPIEVDGQQVDDWTKERIRKAVEGRESVQARKNIMTSKKDLPPMEENPIFQKYRTNRDAMAKNPTSFRKPRKDLPSYPSREYFVGAWRLVSSPIPSEDLLNPDDKEKSDNLILRVDGTTFGGPILDRENMHKAAGGTWKNFQARWIGGDEESPKTMEQTRLRIRLVVPPEKKRILVLEGEVKRLMMPSNLEEARSSFGIPLVQKANEATEAQYENLLQCEGEMWVEDAQTGENRNKLGRFLLMKIEGNSDPSDYVVTIPRGVRNLD